MRALLPINEQHTA